jgi:hypothetical protein
MSLNLLEGARRQVAIARSALVLLLTVSAALGAAAIGSTSASAASTKTSIEIVSAYTQTDPVPNAPGKGSSYIVKGQPFTVSFNISAPLSTTRSTSVVLTATSGGNDTGLRVTGSVDANATTGQITDAVLADAANGVILKVDVQPSKNTVQPGTLTVDVLKTSLSAPQPQLGSSTLVGIGGGGGIGVPCSPTPADQVCGDLIIPSTRTAVSNLLLSQGCVTCTTGDASSFLQAIFGLAPAPGSTPAEQLLYAEQNPITFIAKCDKTLCDGKGIKSYSVKIALTAGASPTVSQPCSTKGVVDPGALFCTDYRQSTRDNAGDVLLYVLLTDDLKIIFG